MGHNLTLGCLLASVGCCRFTLLIIRNVLDAGAASEMPQDTPQAVFSHSYLHVIYDFFTSATVHYFHLHPKVIRIWSNMLTSLLMIPFYLDMICSTGAVMKCFQDGILEMKQVVGFNTGYTVSTYVAKPWYIVCIPLCHRLPLLFRIHWWHL